MSSRSRSSGVAAAVAALVALGACGSPTRSAVPDSPPRLSATFDLEAHRGGAALTTENTLEAFGRALDIGVSTLELDAQVTRDGRVVVAHDPRVNTDACHDGPTPATPDDLYPYVGKPFAILTLAQVRTLDCAERPAKDFPEQRVASDGRIPLLREVIDLVRGRGADVALNIEIKTQPDDLSVTVPRETYVEAVWQVVRDGSMRDQVMIQSFDWASLRAMHVIAPQARLVALASPRTLQVGEGGPSPWLGGIDIDEVGGDLVAAAKKVPGVVAISPRDDLVDADLVERAHEAVLHVVPWTVDTVPEMKHLIELGVDGLITNRPDVLRTVLSDGAIDLPRQWPARE